MSVFALRSPGIFAKLNLLSELSGAGSSDDRISAKDRRAYLGELLSKDSSVCGNESAAASLMSMFPREF